MTEEMRAARLKAEAEQKRAAEESARREKEEELAAIGSHRSRSCRLHEGRKIQMEVGKMWPDPRKYNPRSLYLFGLNNPFRRLVIAGLF